jgi:outer membrane protein W
MWKPKNKRVGKSIHKINKHMKKIQILALVVLSIITINANAQINVGATIGSQLPMGTFGNSAKVGFGFNAVGKYMLKENMAVGLNLGYIAFGSKIEGASFSMMPITGLFEYHFGSGAIKPYVGADLGIYRYAYTIKGVSVSGYTSPDISDSKMYLGFAPTGGVLYGLSDKLSLCANLKYNYVMSEGDAATWLGTNAGIIYKIK